MNRADIPLHQAAIETLRDRPTLPAPGSGATLARWRALAAIAARDVCLVKVVEAHHDALAILHELGHASPTDGGLWAVWAAEPPGLELTFERTGDGRGALRGSKAWCSGADLVDHALVTARAGDERVLVAVDLDAAGVSSPDRGWNAVGMSRVVSGTLHFDGASAHDIAANGRYLSRPGFWHGGAGIAACWYGAAAAIADKVRTSARVASNPHAAAHLGAMHVELAACAALLRELATAIDAAPQASHQRAVGTVRNAVERCATDVIDRVGRALGPGPLCEDREHAQRCADLAVFIRQCHAERDWQALGEALVDGDMPWTL